MIKNEVGSGGDSNKNSQKVNQIFVLNVKQSNKNSKKNSSRMTPCFINTPNRTNEWNNFNPEVKKSSGGDDIGDLDQEDYEMNQKKPYLRIENENNEIQEELFKESKELKGYVHGKKP